MLESLVWGLLSLVILSVFVNLYLLQERIFKNSSRKKRLRETPAIVKSYLEDQTRKTKMVPRNQSLAHIHSEVVKLRSAYLAIEAKSLNWDIDSDEYWNIINTKLKQLYDLLTKQKMSKALSEVFGKVEAIKYEVDRSDSKNKNKDSVKKILEKFKLACMENADNPTKIKHYNDKLEALLKKFGDTRYRKLANKAGAYQEYSDSSSGTLQSFRSSIRSGDLHLRKIDTKGSEVVGDSLDKYRNNSTKLKKSITQYENDLEKVKGAIERASSGAVISASDVELSDTITQFDELSEQIQDANESEITRLRNVVKDQRVTIAEFETSLTLIEEEEVLSVDFGILRRSLQEAEQCVSMLEDELERLKLKNLEAHNPSNTFQGEDEKATSVPFVLSDASIEVLQKTIVDLESEISKSKGSEQRYPILVEFYRESFGAQTIEDISLLLHQTLTDLGADAKLLIFSPSRDIEVCSRGKIPDRNKILIRSMQVNEVNPNQKGGIVAFRFLNFGGVVSPILGKWTDGQMDVVIDVLRNADKILDQVKSAQSNRVQKSKIDDCANLAKRLAGEIDRSLGEYLKRTKGTVEDTFGQVQDVARARGLNASQVASFKKMEKEALVMLASDDTLRLKTKKKFLQLIQSMES